MVAGFFFTCKETQNQGKESHKGFLKVDCWQILPSFQRKQIFSYVFIAQKLSSQTRNSASKLWHYRISSLLAQTPRPYGNRHSSLPQIPLLLERSSPSVAHIGNQAFILWIPVERVILCKAWYASFTQSLLGISSWLTTRCNYTSKRIFSHVFGGLDWM